ncbi:MAG: ABC transporter permease [Planctomycetes bacterium]|nr:ABC transporter permease [Planctomycetota bacterium]
MSLLGLGIQYFRTRLLLLMSAVAIALGVAVLFTVLAVMNGFLAELETAIRDLSGDAVIETARTQNFEQHTLQDFEGWLADVDGIETLEPQLTWYGLVGRRGGRSVNDPRSADLSGLMLVGTDEDIAPDVAAELGPDDPLPMKMGVGAAKELGLQVGDEIGVITFVGRRRGRGAPLQRTFKLVGTFSTGRYDQDLNRAVVRRHDLSQLLRHATGFSQVIVRTQADADPLLVAVAIENRLQVVGTAAPGYRTTYDWRNRGGNLLRAVENQRGMLSIVFFFIVLVAAYQLVATLTLTVSEKRRDIGVLRALGATPKRIVRFFVTLGLLISVLGIVMGLALGHWLINNLPTVERWIGGGQPIFRAEIYKFDHIPVAVDTQSVLLLVGMTLLAALIFSLIPAWRASRVTVIKSLRKR